MLERLRVKPASSDHKSGTLCHCTTKLCAHNGAITYLRCGEKYCMSFIISAGRANSIKCRKLSVCVLTRMAQIITIAPCNPVHTDCLMTCDHKLKLRQSDLIYWVYRSWAASWVSLSMGCLFCLSTGSVRMGKKKNQNALSPNAEGMRRGAEASSTEGARHFNVARGSGDRCKKASHKR